MGYNLVARRRDNKLLRKKRKKKKKDSVEKFHVILHNHIEINGVLFFEST